MSVIERIAKGVTEPDDLSADLRFVHPVHHAGGGCHDGCSALGKDVDAMMATCTGVPWRTEPAADIALGAGLHRERERRRESKPGREPSAAQQFRLRSKNVFPFA